MKSVEPWVEAYIPDFVEIHRIIERTPGFAFQPLELPSPDLARALARWLGEQGCAVSTIDLSEEGAWRTLASRLEHLPPAQPPAVVLVIDGGEAPKEATIHHALAQVNMGRDLIARSAERTILWCGRSRFQRWAGDFAPDLWSVGSSPYFVPLRRVEDLPSSLRTGVGLWWTGASGHDVCDLERAFATEPEVRTKVEAGLRLAEARIVRGDRLGAQSLLRDLAPNVAQKAPLLMARTIGLIRAAHDEPRNEPPTTEMHLRGAIAEAQRLGAGHREAQLRRALSETILANDPDRGEEAAAEMLIARARFLELRDLEAALRCAHALVVQYAMWLSEEMIREIEAQAQGTVDAKVTTYTTAYAELTLARTALLGQRFTEAEERLRALINSQSVSQPFVVFELDAREVLLDLALQLGDFDQAEEHARALLSLAEQAELPAAQGTAHRHLSRVLAARGLPRPAAREILAAIDILSHLYDGTGSDFDYRLLELYALRAKALQIADDVLLTHFGPSWMDELPDIEDWLDQRSEQIEGSGQQVPERTRLLHQQLKKLQTAVSEQEIQEAKSGLKRLQDDLHEELESAGIDPYDVDTWPNPDTGAVNRSGEGSETEAL